MEVTNGFHDRDCNGRRLGSLVGGSATVATAWITQRTLSKRELMGAEIRTHEACYGEFIRMLQTRDRLV
jgi:hypothetical protein